MRKPQTDLHLTWNISLSPLTHLTAQIHRITRCRPLNPKLCSVQNPHIVINVYEAVQWSNRVCLTSCEGAVNKIHLFLPIDCSCQLFDTHNKSLQGNAVCSVYAEFVEPLKIEDIFHVFNGLFIPELGMAGYWFKNSQYDLIRFWFIIIFCDSSKAYRKNPIGFLEREPVWC